MVTDELTDGKRIGQLFSSEIHGHERGVLGTLRVADADSEVDPTDDGAFAYGVDFESEDGESTRIAAVYVQPDRVRIEFHVGVETAAKAAGEAGLRARPKAVEPPRTLVFVENGAEVKAALRVVRTVAERLEESG